MKCLSPWRTVIEVQVTLSRSVRALALLSLADQAKEKHNSATMFTTFIRQPTTTLHQQVELFSESESLSTTKPYKSMSVEDRYNERIINSTISKSNDHYCMTMTPLAKIRLRHLTRRLERDKDLHEKYIAKGHARKLTKEQAEQRGNKTWYLPHHPVTSPNKPGKIRVVFDAAAKFQGISLNDQLLQGPDYINNLVGVLMRFRQEEVVLRHKTDVPPGSGTC